MLNIQDTPIHAEFSTVLGHFTLTTCIVFSVPMLLSQTTFDVSEQLSRIIYFTYAENSILFAQLTGNMAPILALLVVYISVLIPNRFTKPLAMLAMNVIVNNTVDNESLNDTTLIIWLAFQLILFDNMCSYIPQLREVTDFAIWKISTVIIKESNGVPRDSIIACFFITIFVASALQQLSQYYSYTLNYSSIIEVCLLTSVNTILTSLQQLIRNTPVSIMGTVILAVLCIVRIVLQ